MISIRKSKDRGHANHGWLDTYHTFSFADYFDRRFMGFSDLRVINEDRVQAAEGFGTHPHRDMEIITYVIDGALEHKDSMGTGSVIHSGDVQYMNAGTGVTHSEFNHSKTTPVHLLQIWIQPSQKGLKPAYDQKNFSKEQKQGKLQLLVSNDGDSGSIRVHQDVKLYASILDAGQTVNLPLQVKRHAWVQLVSGQIEVNGQKLQPGDGAAVIEETELKVTGRENQSEFLVFDLR